MPNHDSTALWIKTSVLDKALKLEKKKKINNDASIVDKQKKRPSWKPRKSIKLDDWPTNGDNWEWVLATAQYLEIEPKDWDESGIGGMTLKVDKNSGRHSGMTIHIPKSISTDDGIAIANSWAQPDKNDQTDNYVPPDDLTDLTHLHEPAVIHCLRMRYQNNLIYTATGPVLLAVNPFKECPGLYSVEKKRKYWLKCEITHNQSSNDKEQATNSPADDLPPHIFGSADYAYRSMIRGLEDIGAWEGRRCDSSANVDQSILVSGESGSGKTVTTKYIMEYLAFVSEQKSLSSDDALKKISENNRNKSNIETKVLESNPILESFGNARTIRNDNSSRFGKFVELQFNKIGRLTGANIDTYLLEKVRLINQDIGERNYHIFYEILAGATVENRKNFLLEKFTPEDFKMTSASRTYDRRDGVLDFMTFQELLAAMNTMGFTKDDENNVMRVACALLHFSNLTIIEHKTDESMLDTENSSLKPVLSLLGVSVEELSHTLCNFVVKAGGDSYKVCLGRNDATRGLEALMKAIYDALFKFIVRLINKLINVDSSENSQLQPDKAACINVLDIFGFESFKKNSFEQFCINYCNEVLQHNFNKFVFDNEQKEYEKEGLEWSFIEYRDNKGVLDLIDKKGSGMIPLLNDLCKTHGTTDGIFASIIYNRFKGHSNFTADSRQVSTGRFGIMHYAGAVEYDTIGFIEKNKDEFPRDASNLLLSSSSSFIHTLADIIVESTSSRKGKLRQAESVASQFSTQLKVLCKRIYNTSPHYVRCFKPNDSLAPDNFVPSLVSHQLRCAGVIEAVRVSRVGFPQRYTHEMFVQRYRCLMLKEFYDSTDEKSHRDLCELLIKSVARRFANARQSNNVNEKELPTSKRSLQYDISASGIRMGSTNVFFCNKTFEKIEVLRRQRIHAAAIQLQRSIRQILPWRKFRNTVRAVIVIQKTIRKSIARDQMQSLRIHFSAVDIQSNWRGHQVRRKYKIHFLRTRSAIKIQCFIRMFIAKQKFNELFGCRPGNCRCIELRKELNRMRIMNKKSKPNKIDASLLDENAQLRRSKEKLEKEVEKLKVKLKQNEVKTKEIKNAHKHDIASLKSKLKSIKSTASSLVDGNASLMREKEASKKKVEEIKFVLGKKEQQISKITTEHENNVKELEFKLDAEQSLVRVLQNEKDSSMQEMTALRYDVVELAKALNVKEVEAKEDEKAYQREINDLRYKLELTKQQAGENTNNVCDALEKSMMEAFKEVNKVKKESISFQYQLNRVKSDYQRACELADNANSEIETLKKDLNYFVEKNKRLKTQYSEYKAFTNDKLHKMKKDIVRKDLVFSKFKDAATKKLVQQQEEIERMKIELLKKNKGSEEDVIRVLSESQKELKCLESVGMVDEGDLTEQQSFSLEDCGLNEHARESRHPVHSQRPGLAGDRQQTCEEEYEYSKTKQTQLPSQFLAKKRMAGDTSSLRSQTQTHSDDSTQRNDNEEEDLAHNSGTNAGKQSLIEKHTLEHIKIAMSSEMSSVEVEFH